MRKSASVLHVLFLEAYTEYTGPSFMKWKQKKKKKSFPRDSNIDAPFGRSTKNKRSTCQITRPQSAASNHNRVNILRCLLSCVVILQLLYAKIQKITISRWWRHRSAVLFIHFRVKPHSCRVTSYQRRFFTSQQHFFLYSTWLILSCCCSLCCKTASHFL